MKYQAVIFDLDGTLLDTLQDLADATNCALETMGFPPHSTETYKYFIGEGREKLAELALPTERRNQDIIDTLVNLIDQFYSLYWDAHTQPFKGIPELLNELTARQIKMAVLSNKSDHFTKLMVERLLSNWQFEVVLGTLPSTPKKPDPSGATQISEKINIKPGNIVFLGDSGIDMKTAVAAGMYPVGASWGFRTREEMIKDGAKLLIERPNDLIDFLFA